MPPDLPDAGSVDGGVEVLQAITFTNPGTRVTRVTNFVMQNADFRVVGPSSIDSRGSVVWTYDPMRNSVNFEPVFVPEPGRTVTFTYWVACLP